MTVSPYGDHVVDRQLITLSDRRVLRKVWDNGYVEHYWRLKEPSADPAVIRRAVITKEEWDELARANPVYRVDVNGNPTLLSTPDGSSGTVA